MFWETTQWIYRYRLTIKALAHSLKLHILNCTLTTCSQFRFVQSENSINTVATDDFKISICHRVLHKMLNRKQMGFAYSIWNSTTYNRRCAVILAIWICFNEREIRPWEIGTSHSRLFNVIVWEHVSSRKKWILAMANRKSHPVADEGP